MGNKASSGGLSTFVSVTRKETERGEAKSMNIRFAVSGMKGYRETMEDQHIYAVGIPVNGQSPEILQQHAVFGVFDGHGGNFTSSFLKENFLHTLSNREELQKYASLPENGPRGRSDVNAIILLQKALVNTFIQLDERLLPLQKERTNAILSGKITPPPATECDNDEASEEAGVARVSRSSLGERSGSTAVVVLITPSHIICANTGDSRAVLRRNGNTLPLSFDHKPSELPERLRIKASGGFVKCKRVNGDLAVSRAFGDFSYKDNQEADGSVTKQKVIVVPDLIVYPRMDGKDEFIVLACDGVWDVASSKQLSDFVHRLLAEGEVDLGNICEETLDTCLDRRSRDNMTMMLVSLPGIKMDRSHAAVLNNAIWGHRTARQARNATYMTISAAQDSCSVIQQPCLTSGEPVTV